MSYGTASLLGGRPVFHGGDVPNTVTIPSSNTGGIQIYNTADQTTDYERLEFVWTANLAQIRTRADGTGLLRALAIGRTGAQTQTFNGDHTLGQHQFRGTPASVANSIFVAFGTYTNSATSGTNIGLSLTPTYNQTSGTAANIDLLVNRTETAIGSGTQRLMSLQVDGVERFGVSNAGAVVLANQTTGPGAGAGTLTNAPSAGDPDFWLPISINGTAHWIPAWAA